jgi:hypothetical protein
MGPPWSNYLFHPPFPWQALFPPTTFGEKRKVEINKHCKVDLHFLQFALKKCRDGVDLNTIAYRCPTHAYRSDSCPAGLGNYSNEGFVWRFYLEPKYQSHMSNSLLEHIVAIVTLWVNIIAGRLTHDNCALSMTDSTTSEGWLKKTNFIKDGEEPIQATICLKVARLHASQSLSQGMGIQSMVSQRQQHGC